MSNSNSRKIDNAPEHYQNIPLHSVGSRAMLHFIQDTEKTPDVGLENYQFRIYGRTEARAKNFVQSMRTELSRLRARLRGEKIPFVQFSVQHISTDLIVDGNGDTLQPSQLLITLARAMNRKNPAGRLSLNLVKALMPDDHISSRNYTALSHALESKTEVAIDCTKWSAVVAAVWAVQNNYAVFKRYDENENQFIVGRY